MMSFRSVLSGFLPVALEYLPLFTDRLVLVAPATSPTMSAAEWLSKRPLLRLYDERGQGLNTQIDRFCTTTVFSSHRLN
jgi:DNA-binding transcriptional LysR family regulator